MEKQSDDIGTMSYHMGKLAILADSYRNLRISMNMSKRDHLEHVRAIDADISSLEKALEKAVGKGDLVEPIELIKTYSEKYLPKSELKKRPKATKTEERYDKPADRLNWYGYDSLGDAVNLYVYENPKQTVFVVREFAKYFGTQSAPVYNAFKARPDLIEKRNLPLLNGVVAFVRSTK